MRYWDSQEASLIQVVVGRSIEKEGTSLDRRNFINRLFENTPAPKPGDLLVQATTNLRTLLAQQNIFFPIRNRNFLFKCSRWSYMEKRTPHYKLSVIKALVKSKKIRATLSALTGVAALGFDFNGIIGVVMVLTQKDFYKSMATYADHRIW